MKLKKILNDYAVSNIFQHKKIDYFAIHSFIQQITLNLY
jgi:hypothetical protein